MSNVQATDTLTSAWRMMGMEWPPFEVLASGLTHSAGHDGWGVMGELVEARRFPNRKEAR